MPGPIQSVERAAAVIELLGASSMGLSELSRALDLPKPTVHGIVRTLVDVGFARQDPDTGRYRLGDRLDQVGHDLDPHELRSLATNWSNRLAARTGLEVHLALPRVREELELLDHVFRPDDSVQRLRVGERQPLHATALGKVLLALAPGLPSAHALRMVGYTSATILDHRRMVEELNAVRRHGWAMEAGEHRPLTGGLAAPVRDVGGVVVAAVGVVGAQEQIVGARHVPRPELVEEVVRTGRAISEHVMHRWAQ